jgi:hypothetical protein
MRWFALEKSMLSLAKCREILGADCRLTDTELEAVRDQLSAMADIAIKLIHEGADERQADAQLSISGVPEDGRCEVEERAAIFEFEAGMSKEVAESIAVFEWLASCGGSANECIN